MEPQISDNISKGTSPAARDYHLCTCMYIYIYVHVSLKHVLSLNGLSMGQCSPHEGWIQWLLKVDLVCVHVLPIDVYRYAGAVSLDFIYLHIILGKVRESEHTT